MCSTAPLYSNCVIVADIQLERVAAAQRMEELVMKTQASNKNLFESACLHKTRLRMHRFPYKTLYAHVKKDSDVNLCSNKNSKY